MMRRLDDQLGKVVVVVGVFTVLAIIHGSVLLLVYIAIAAFTVVLVVVNATRRRADQSGGVGSAFSYKTEWPVDRDPDLARLHELLAERGVATEIEGRKLLISRGSKVRTRLWGGYHVKIDQLPLSGEVSVGPAESQAGRREVTLKLRDEMGISIRDGRLGRQFDQSFADISERVQQALQAA